MTTKHLLREIMVAMLPILYTAPHEGESYQPAIESDLLILRHVVEGSEIILIKGSREKSSIKSQSSFDVFVLRNPTEEIRHHICCWIDVALKVECQKSQVERQTF